jgi:hypothetical protein
LTTFVGGAVFFLKKTSGEMPAHRQGLNGQVGKDHVEPRLIRANMLKAFLGGTS